MKYFNKYWLGAIALSVLASCADDSPLDFVVEKPESITKLEYLNDYDVLKTYVDRNVSPNFKLGAGVSMSDFTQTGLGYSLIVSNFDEITAGYGMKHGAVVQDDGSLNLNKVENFISTAKDAGISIYGHTLCWHSNQNAEYLNSTIAPIVITGTGGPALDPSVITNSDFETGTDGWAGWGNNSTRALSAEGEGYGDTGYAYTFTNPSVTDYYNAQVAYDLSPLEVGSTYQLNFKVKANTDGSIRADAQSTADYSSDGISSFEINQDWKEYTFTVMITKDDRNRFVISYGDFLGTVYMDDVTFSRINPNAGGPVLDPSVITNTDFESGADGWMGWGNGSTLSLSADGEGYGDTGFAYTFTNPSVTDYWNVQIAYDFPSLEMGSDYVLNFQVRANTDGVIRAEAQSTVDYSSDSFGTFEITQDWKEYNLELTVSKDDRTRFVMSYGDFAGTVYIDDITLRRVNPDGGGDQIIEKTPEEKRDTIASELERWISGMMEVSKDYVKAWDVVNEPMDDGNPYELKSGIGKSEMADDEFYWQDYLGKDYAVMAINLARKYGNTDDLLFINDYNLEYNLDKCKGLIAYVEYVESKGVVVDGIGTQMHISVDSDKDQIVEMFQLLGATGKMIKVSELDMGVRGLKTTEVTDEDYIAQAEMYRFVVEKYLEIIPPEQQYGITVWSPLDSSEGSSWRGGEPIGLWTEGYNRKRAYAGFANGLEGE